MTGHVRFTYMPESEDYSLDFILSFTGNEPEQRTHDYEGSPGGICDIAAESCSGCTLEYSAGERLRIEFTPVQSATACRMLNGSIERSDKFRESLADYINEELAARVRD